MSVSFNGRKPETVICFIFLFSLLIFAVGLRRLLLDIYIKLGNVVSKMCQDADLQGQFSNRSLRATTATRGLEKRNLR